MEEFERQYPDEAGMMGAEGIYDEMYYYDQLNGAPLGIDGQNEQFAGVDFSGLDAEQRIAQIQQLRAMSAANGELGHDGYDSEDEARFFDNNDLANRIWEDNELFQDV